MKTQKLLQNETEEKLNNINILDTNDEENDSIEIPKLKRNTKKMKGKVRTIGKYQYFDENNNLIYEILRREGGENRFLVRSIDENGEETFQLLTDTTLYNLPNTLKAVKEGKTIWITEGESKVETLNKMGFISTTCPFKLPNKWSSKYNKYFEGAKKIIVLADNDLKGEEFAEKVVNSLTNTLNNVDVYGPLMLRDICPNLKDGGDIDDLVEILGWDNVKQVLEACERNTIEEED